MSRPQLVSSVRRRDSTAGGARVRRALLNWFRKHQRPLPWRASRDAYRVWISEVMLQQTQVATVVPYYQRFLDSFPTVRDLARAPLEGVLQLWSGLGYYRRARQLHAAAERLVAEFDGRFPATLEEAKRLPGVGDYTAAAVLSIAYGAPVAALDGNVARVIARLEALPGSLNQPPFRKAVEARLAAFIPSKRSRAHPGDFNEALMELGQTICLPRSPRCPICPIRRACRACCSGNPESFPSPRPRRSSEVAHLAAALILGPAGARRCANHPSADGNRAPSFLLTRGLDGGLMADLWNFPSSFGSTAPDARRRLEAKLADFCGATVAVGEEVTRVRHNVTYRQIQVRVYRASVSGLGSNGFRWMSITQLRRAAVSQLARKIAEASAAALN